MVETRILSFCKLSSVNAQWSFTLQNSNVYKHINCTLVLKLYLWSLRCDMGFKHPRIAWRDCMSEN